MTMTSSGNYRWVQVFCIQGELDSLAVGDVVNVEKSNGEVKQVVVTDTWTFTTKSGKKLTRAQVEDS